MRRPKESSTGEFNYETWNPFWDKRVNSYTNDFEYSTVGKIKRKNQNNTGLLTETNETVTITETTYDWTYEYGGTHPNAVTKAGTREFVYDMNGNMTTMTDTAKSLARTLLWDEENRLKKTTDASGTNSSITTYSYDAKGMRAIKKGKYGTVQYVSENYTVRNKDLISKHVFAGNTRLVSKTVMQEEKSGTMVATEQGSYYYHPDHLGSSSVVTDKSGKFYEQLEYFPYGETWIHNKADTEQESTPYKFTAKELDVETGLYYYGARYYDPKLSRWIAVDPPLSRGDYLPKPPINEDTKEYNNKLPGIGGVFNTINLDAYQYGGQNPIKLIDPDGELIEKQLVVQDKVLNNGNQFVMSLPSGIVEEKDDLTSISTNQLNKEYKDKGSVTKEMIEDRKKNILFWNGLKKESDLKEGMFIITSHRYIKEMFESNAVDPESFFKPNNLDSQYVQSDKAFKTFSEQRNKQPKILIEGMKDRRIKTIFDSKIQYGGAPRN